MKFKVIMADPPWAFKNGAGNGSAKNHYSLMETKDLMELNIRGIADDDAILFLWASWAMLPDALQLMKAWGFAYKTGAFMWIKTNPRQNLCQTSFLPVEFIDAFTGCGNYTRANSEPVLLGRRGDPVICDHSISQVLLAPVQGHSKKPEGIRQAIERLCGNVPRVELFARQRAPGWVSLGNEINGKDIKEEIDAIAKEGWAIND